MAKKSKRSRRSKLHRTCGAMAAHMMLLERYPSYRVNQMRLEDATNRRRERRADLRQAKIITIKTVVNVVYNTAQQNVSAAQIKSQIAALNKDFRATNPDKSQTPTAWKGLVTDARIKFKLVKTTRTKTTEIDFTHDDGVKSAATGGIAPFNSKTHLNVWVCPLRDSLLGYAQFPGGPQSSDGVVINYLAFGTSGTAQAQALVPLLAAYDVTTLVSSSSLRCVDTLAAYAEAGVTTLSVASYAGSLEERVGALRTLAAALDESGLGD